MATKTANQHIQDWLGASDTITGAAVTMDSNHYALHTGGLYRADHRFASVTNGGTVQFVFTPATTKQPHLVYDVTAGGALTTTFTEGPTGTLTGSAVLSYNLNRLSSNTALSSLIHTPAAGTAGTVVLSSRYLAGGATPTTRSGGGIRVTTEYLLGTASKYMLEIVNVSGGAVQVAASFEWYEEDVV